MDVIIHKRIESLDELVRGYGELTSEFREVTIFQDIDWMKDWWEQKKESKEITPYIVEIREENETIGIIPLYLSDKEFANIRFRMLRPIGIGESNYLLPILSKNYPPEKILKKAMGKIYEDRKSWDCIHWGDLPQGSNMDSFLMNHLSKGNRLVDRSITNISPHIELTGDIETVLSKVNKKFLKGILYDERRLKREGELKFHRVENEHEIEPIMNEFFKLHCERWKNTSTPSKYEDSKEREFVLRVVKNLFKRDLLYLAYLTHNDNIIVTHFGMTYGKTNYLYRHAMNMEYRKFSLGHLFAYYLLHDSYKEGYEVIDFLRGNEEYKQNWGAVNAVNLEYLLFNSSIKSLLFRLVNSTYYSKKFSQTSLIKQLPMKSVIRGFTFLIGIKDKFGQREKVNSGTL